MIVAGGLLAVAALWPCVWMLGGGEVLDLEVYLTGGRAVLHGHDLYGASVHVRQYGFTYPPFAALIFALPSLVPLGLAIAVLTGVSLTSLGVLIRLSAADLVHRLGREGSTAALLVVVAMVACQPVRSTLWNGQVELLLAAMIMIDLVVLRGRAGHGVLVGLAAAIKLTPLIFIAYLLLIRRFRAAAVATATFLAATVGTWMLLPADSSEYWTHALIHGNGIGDISRPSNQSILGVLRRLLGASAAGPLWAVLIVPTAVLGLALATRVHASGREPLAAAVVGMTGCLISPVSWSHHWVWLVPWIAGAAASLPRRRRSEQVPAVVFIGYLVVVNAASHQAVEATLPARLVLGNAYVLAVVVAFAIVVRNWRERTADERAAARSAPTR